MHRYAKRHHAPSIHHDCFDNDRHFVIERSDAISQREMLVNLAAIQKRLPKVTIMPTFMGSVLCGVIFRNGNVLTWYDFDIVTCKLLSPREIYKTDVVSIRREIHKGGLVNVNASKISIRSAR